MPQINLGLALSLSLSAENGTLSKRAERWFALLPSSASCRRSGRSPALPYPPHEWQDFIMPVGQPLAKGTSLLCKKGDISTLH
jgi:hypothetical protein